MATLKRMVLHLRPEKGDTNFSSASGNVGMAFFEATDRSLKWCMLVSDTGITTSHFVKFDDGESVPAMSLLMDQENGKAYFLTTYGTSYTVCGSIT